MLILFGLFYLSKESNNLSEFPFYPIIVDHLGRKSIHDYFDMSHINDKAAHGKVLKGIIYSLKQNKNISHNIEKLEQLLTFKNGNAAFILGIINEFGLFNKEIDDKAAARYYELGSKFGNLECKSSLAYYYRYGIGGKKEDQAKSITLTKDSMYSCVFSAMRMAYYYYEDNKVDKAISVLLPLADLTIGNSTYFDFLYGTDHEIRKYEGITSPLTPKKSSTEMVEHLQALSKSGNPKAKYELLLKNLGNRNYEQAVQLVLEDYYQIGKAFKLAKSEEDIQQINLKYGPYFSILSLMKRYGMNFKEDFPDDNETKTNIFKNKQNLIQLKKYEMTKEQLFEKAFKYGDPHAYAELGLFYLTRGNAKVAETGQKILMAAVNVSYIPAIHIYGTQLIFGRRPFDKDVNLAKQCFLQCYHEKRYLPSMLSLALIHKFENNPQKSFLMIKELLENSFLFNDAKKAVKFLVDKNYKRALQYYKRFADIGSYNASFNVYQLYKLKGDDLFKDKAENYFNNLETYNDFDNSVKNGNRKENIDDIRKRWLIESSPDAYYENGQQILKNGGDVEKALECFINGAKNHAFSAFKAGMLLMHSDPKEAINYLTKSQNLNPILKTAVMALKVRIFIENIPYLFRNRHVIMNIIFNSKKVEYIDSFELFMAKGTYNILKVLTYAIPFFTLYFLIIVRLKLPNAFISKNDFE